MKSIIKTKKLFTGAIMLLLMAQMSNAAVIEDATWSTDTTDITNDYLTNGAGSWTWTINPDVTLTLGNNVSNAGRFFVGYGGAQTLTLDGGGTLNLFGHHSADAVLGRIGFIGASGTIVVEDGVSLIGGSDPFRYSHVSNFITITDGLVDFTGNGAAAFVREGAGTLTFNLADNAATLLLPGNLSAANVNTTWTGLSVAASGSNDLSFSFDGTNTTITAVPELSSAALLLGLGGLALTLRRRRQA